MAQYNIYQLKQYANKFLQDNYSMELEAPLRLNGRMKTTCGWFKHTKYGDGRDIPKCVELNRFFVENNEPTVVLDVLRHELVHYALFMQRKPYKDGHFMFENELKRLGIVSQKTINKYTIESKPKNMYIYKCSCCGHEYKRHRALPNGGRGCTCGRPCNGSLIDMGRKLVTA